MGVGPGTIDIYVLEKRFLAKLVGKPNIVSAGKHIIRLVKLKPGAWE